MPRIKNPTQQLISQRPREYALLQQLNPGPDGNVDQQAFQDMLQKYGNAKDTNSGEDLSFDDFASLFIRPSTSTESGEGDCVGYAAFDTTGHLRPWRFARRATQPHDVRIQITHVGVCHSDVHQARNDWKNAMYPMVPGHEIVGFVIEIGSAVTRHKVGDRVGVGCMISSCQNCHICNVMQEEQYCPGRISTYNRKDRDGATTYGGYSTHIVVTETFVLRIPESISLPHAAPLLCAGITVYSPIRKFGLDKPGLNVGVVGLGGLGHMAVKFLKAMGVTTTVISTSLSKKESALNVLGADAFVLSTDETQTKALQGTLDAIINTVPANHDMGALLSLMKVDGTMVYVGAPAECPAMPTFQMLFRRHRVVGSLYGGIKETQEMLDYCAEKQIACDCEIIPVDYVNQANERILNKDIHYRFVIDIQGSLVA